MTATAPTELFTGVEHAHLYSKFRPCPPQECINYIVSYLQNKINPPFKTAIDVGCGSGQSTKVLSPYFDQVFGLDVSEAQIDCAKAQYSAPNIEYKAARGEKLDAESSSVQLVTFCNSAHWCNQEEIFAEVQRVLTPNGVIALYGAWIVVPKFEDKAINSKISELINEYYVEEKLGPYWSKERFIVQGKYKSINLPFRDIQRADFPQKFECSLADYFGYLRTWSTYQKYRRETGDTEENLLKEILDKFLSILHEDQSPEKINITAGTDYFILIGRK